MGRPRTPTVLRVLAGNPGKRKMPAAEPKPATGMPPMPDYLTPEARLEWDRIAPHLLRLGLLTTLDGQTLGCYCQAHGRHVEAERVLARDGLTVTTPNGFSAINPMHTVSRQAVDQMNKLLAEFGLSPASRSRLGAVFTTRQADALDFEF